MIQFCPICYNTDREVNIDINTGNIRISCWRCNNLIITCKPNKGEDVQHYMERIRRGFVADFPKEKING